MLEKTCIEVNEHLTPAKMDTIYRVLSENRNGYLSNLNNKENLYVRTIVLNADEIRCGDGNKFSAFERFLKNICGNYVITYRITNFTRDQLFYTKKPNKAWLSSHA